MLLVVLDGCIRFGDDAVGEFMEGEYKEWLDFRFHTIVVQEVDLAFEGYEVVALITLENIGSATPGIDSPWSFVDVAITSRNFEREDRKHHGRVSLTGEGKQADPSRFYTSEAAEQKGVQHETRTKNHSHRETSEHWRWSHGFLAAFRRGSACGGPMRGHNPRGPSMIPGPLRPMISSRQAAKTRRSLNSTASGGG